MRIEIKSVHYHDEPETILYRYPELKKYNTCVRFLDENNIRGTVTIEIENVADLMCLSEKIDTDIIVDSTNHCLFLYDGDIEEGYY